MPTPKQKKNLRRGGVPANAASAAHARAAKAAYRADAERIADEARTNPWEAYEELHKVMTLHITKLLRDEQRGNDKPVRETTDRLREYRQTTEAISTYLGGHRSALDDARQFFAELDDRIRSLPCANCGHTMADDAYPLDADLPNFTES